MRGWSDSRGGGQGNDSGGSVRGPRLWWQAGFVDIHRLLCLHCPQQVEVDAQGDRAIGCAINRGSDSVTLRFCPVDPVERKYEQLPPPPPHDTHNPMMHVVASQEDDGHEGQGQPSGVNAVLPQLCRLGLHLSAREAQGARPPASIWDVRQCSLSLQ